MARSATVCHCGRGELWIDGPKCNRQIQFWILPSTLQPFSVAQKKRGLTNKNRIFGFKFRSFFGMRLLSRKGRISIFCIHFCLWTSGFCVGQFHSLNLRWRRRTLEMQIASPCRRCWRSHRRCDIAMYFGSWCQASLVQMSSSVHWYPFFASFLFVYKSKWGAPAG